MGSTYFEEDPPTPDYVQAGWHCFYHVNQMCHNPMDCYLVPLWRRATYTLDQVSEISDRTQRVSQGLLCSTCGHKTSEHDEPEAYGQHGCSRSYFGGRRCSCAGYRIP